MSNIQSSSGAKFGLRDLMIPVVTGIFACIGAIAGPFIKGSTDLSLAHQEFYAKLILKALESNKEEDRIATLDMLVKTKLIDNDTTRSNIETYINLVRSKPSENYVPQISNNNTSNKTKNAVDNRLFMLYGSSNKFEYSKNISSDLEKSNIDIVGSKQLNDNTRPSGPEVRYFNIQDKEQARIVAALAAETLKVPTVETKIYNDPSALPGYIELWLGQ